jgi:NADPH2:quinone reductase
LDLKNRYPLQKKIVLLSLKLKNQQGYDLLVKIAAISVNPVDFKIRKSTAINNLLDTPKIIGWDAVGIVEAVGDNTTRFKIGDEVYYVGDIT